MWFLYLIGYPWTFFELLLIISNFTPTQHWNCTRLQIRRNYSKLVNWRIPILVRNTNMQKNIWGQVYLVHFRQNIDNGWHEKTRCGWICFRSFSGHRWPHGIREEKVDYSFDLDIISASVHLLEKNLISGIVQVCAISSCGSYIWRSGSIRSLWCKKGIPWSDALCKCDVATIYMMRMLLLDIICGQLLLPGFRKSRNSLCRSCCGRATWDGNGSQVYNLRMSALKAFWSIFGASQGS